MLSVDSAENDLENDSLQQPATAASEDVDDGAVSDVLLLYPVSFVQTSSYTIFFMVGGVHFHIYSQGSWRYAGRVRVTR